MRVHWLQHVPFEGLGSIQPVLASQGHTISCTRLYENDDLPSVGRFDWLIVMGGPMGVADERQFPWLVAEKRLIDQAIKAGKTVLGICLGAQLIADVLGARVFANRHKEIGWWPIERAGGANVSRLGRLLPQTIEAFHWHGDTFDLPAGAVHLARSQACEHQAFALEDRVLALQFHLETTRPSAEALIDHCAGDLDDGPFVQSPAQMLADDQHFRQINGLMQSLLIALDGGP